MDKTLQQVVDLALNGSIEQRCAVLLVLAALKLQNPEVLKAVAAALAEARKINVPMAVTVVDNAGQLVVFDRMDNTQTGSIAVSPTPRSSP